METVIFLLALLAAPAPAAASSMAPAPAPAVVVAAPASPAATVEPGRVCPNLEAGLRRWVEGRLEKATVRPALRVAMALELARRIVVEAERFGLDPIVLATVAWIESDFRPWVRGLTKDGRRAGEIGVWQLIPGDSPVLEALDEVAGCEPSATVWPHLRDLWRRKWKAGGRCTFPEIGAKRQHVGRFNLWDLRDLTISTWVAAWEIRRHVRVCKGHAPEGHSSRPGWLRVWARRNPGVTVAELDRYVHFNTGGHRWDGESQYRYRLFTRYLRTRAGVCDPVKDSPTEIAGGDKARATAERAKHETEGHGNHGAAPPRPAGPARVDPSSGGSPARVATGRAEGSQVDPGAALPARGDGRAGPDRGGGPAR